jgi:hypothetical protein
MPPTATNNKNDFNLLQCNPATLKETRTTCLPATLLERLRDSWNNLYPRFKIPLSIKTKERLWAALRRRLAAQRECNSEYCALKEIGDASTQTDGTGYFRPTQPHNWQKDPDEWHDSMTISRVMEQYEDAFPAFEFIGPAPIDFDSQDSWGRCVVDELCSLDLKQMAAGGTKYIGIVFNLDPHYKEGSHWICAFLDLVIGAAYYYDSYGMPPPSEIRRLLRRCKDQGIQKILWNDIRHQRKDSECGTYCLYVLISLLQGRTFADICKNPVPDDIMNSMRDLLFSVERPRETAIRNAIKVLASNRSTK